MTYRQLKAERTVRKVTQKTRRFLDRKDAMETALDLLAFVSLIAVVVIVFFLDGFMEAIPEDMTVPYILIGVYLTVYVIHKFEAMRKEGE